MLAYIVQRIIIYLAQVLIFKPRRRTKRAQGQTGLDAATLASLCESSATMLERSGLSQLMLRDFRFSRRLTRRDIRRADLAQRLTVMAREVTDSLSLPPLNEVVVNMLPKGSAAPKSFGTYESAQRRVTFYLKPDTFPEPIEAALCHECTHYFMDLRRLDDWRNRQTNECRTDVMACLVGFSRIMVRGYMVMTHARYRVVTWETDSMRVGYLDAVDCENVRKYLMKLRPGLQNRQQARASAADMQAQLSRNLAGAAAMLEQLEGMYAAHGAPGTGRISKKELARLQSALLALETGELRARLKQCQAQGDVSGRLKQVNDLCETLSVLHSAFR